MKKIQLIGVVMIALMVSVMVSKVGNTEGNQAVKPVFNYYENVKLHYGTGNESDFIRIGEKGEIGNSAEYCQDGQLVDLWIYVHNSVAKERNGDPVRLDGPGVAHQTSVQLSASTEAANSHQIVATIDAIDADAVTDTVVINCGDQKIALEYQGVTQFGTPAPNHPTLGQYQLTGNLIDGAQVGYGDGVVPGCWEYRARINAQFKVVVVEDEPVVPEEPVEVPVTPPIVETGGQTGAPLALVALSSLLGVVSYRVIAGRARQ